MDVVIFLITFINVQPVCAFLLLPWIQRGITQIPIRVSNDLFMLSASQARLCCYKYKCENEWTPCPSQYLFIELHKRPGQLVCFPCAGPGCLAAQAMLENWLQVCWVDSLQLLPVWIAKGRGKEAEKQMDAGKWKERGSGLEGHQQRNRETERDEGLCWETKFIRHVCKYMNLLYSADANYRWEAGGERMAPYSTPCWHGGHHLDVLKTHPLQIFIIESLVCQSLEERQRGKEMRETELRRWEK